LDAQSESLAQLDGHAAWVPSQTNGEQLGFAPAEPTATIVQVPGVALQTSQPLAHAVLQHSPSAQRPLAQVEAPPLHDWPFLSLQAPLASQVLAPVQLSRSSALVTVVQVPGLAAQVSQVPLHAVAQQ
jgi:hypothetical protein